MIMSTFSRSNHETLVGQELVTNPKEGPRGRLFRGQCGAQKFPSRCQNFEVHAYFGGRVNGVRNFLSCRDAIVLIFSRRMFQLQISNRIQQRKNVLEHFNCVV